MNLNRLIPAAGVIFGMLWCMPTSIADESASAKKKLLILGQGPDGHPPTTHEFLAGVQIIRHLLSRYEGIDVSTADASEPWADGHERIEQADGIVMFLSEGAKWMKADPKRTQAIERLMNRKGGIVALHWAVGAKDAAYIDICLATLGRCHGGSDRKYVKTQARVSVASTDHPIVRGIRPFDTFDEFYYRLKITDARRPPTTLLTVPIDGNDETCAWAWERPDGGRSFGFVGLHFHENWKKDVYRRLVTQAILWTLDRPIPDSGVDVSIPEEIFALPHSTESIDTKKR